MGAAVIVTIIIATSIIITTIVIIPMVIHFFNSELIMVIFINYHFNFMMANFMC
jgi:hypothetical protein